MRLNYLIYIDIQADFAFRLKFHDAYFQKDRNLYTYNL